MPASTPDPGRPAWARALSRLGPIPRTLAHRDFGIYIAGNTVSLIGTWMQRIGVGWLAWELSHSGAVLGLVAFCDLFPTVVIGPFGGALADRVSRKHLIMVAQSLIMAQAIVLFALTASGLITVELLLALVLFGGAVIGLNQPARLALVPSLVPRADLATAVAINAIVFNLARFIGPALAGVVIVGSGVALVFALNALSFIAFLLALAQLRIKPVAAPAGGRPSMIEAIGEGLAYTARHPGIAPILLLHLAIAAGARPFVELLPGFAAAVFDRGPAGLAILGSTVGIGAIAGGLWLAQRRDQSRLTELTLLHSLVVALAVLGFALSGPFPLAVGFVALAGFAMVASGAGTQTVLQTAVEEGMRGRVLSLFGLIFRGGPALGALVMGTASEVVGLRAPLVAGTLLAALFWLRLWRHRRALAANLDHPAASAPGLGQGRQA
jgi:predicted MFS family arabinose efflux permease